MRNTISELVQRKQSVGELGKEHRIPRLDEFIDREMSRQATQEELPDAEPSLDGLNELFAETIGFGNLLGS